MLIRNATYLKDYQIKIEFIDGTVRIIDLKDFVFSSPVPLVKKYRDIKLFKTFSIEDGILTWNGDFDLNPLNVYQGKYDVHPTPMVEADL